MEFQVFLVFVALSVSIPISVYGTESLGEAYWKMNLGSDANMPKVVKDALLDITNQANEEDVNGAQAYAKKLSVTRAKSVSFVNYAKGAQAYAKKLSETRANSVSFRNYAKGAQAYAKKLSQTRANSVSFINYAKGAQAYAQHLFESRSGSTNQHYANGAQAYAQQQHSKTGTNTASFGKYADGAQAYAQHLSESRSGPSTNEHYGNGAQTYAQQLSETQTDSKGSEILTDDSVLFFFEKDLIYPRSSMKLHFLMGAQEAKFMPSEVTNSIPFSSSKLPEILKYFAVKPGSQNAKTIEQTITSCEFQALKGEEKSCETSLEGMVNYAKSKLGKQIKAVSTEVNEETEQKYQIKSATKISNEKNLVCHKMVYPYAVFYCHTLSKTDIYEVSLVDSTGKKVRAVAVCHKDTSHWNQEHIAFQLLKVKPGRIPICHFLNLDAMVWVPK